MLQKPGGIIALLDEAWYAYVLLLSNFLMFLFQLLTLHIFYGMLSTKYFLFLQYVSKINTWNFCTKALHNICEKQAFQQAKTFSNWLHYCSLCWWRKQLLAFAITIWFHSVLSIIFQLWITFNVDAGYISGRSIPW